MPGFMPGRPAHGSLAWAAEQFARLLNSEVQASSRHSRHRAAAKSGRDARQPAIERVLERQRLDSGKTMHFEPTADFDTPGQKSEAPQRPLDGSAPRGNVNQASRMEHLRMLTKIAGLSPASRDAAREMAANLELSKATASALSDPSRNIDKKREREFFEIVRKDPDLAGAFASWTDYPEEGAISRQDAARRVIEHHARVYGYPMPRVAFENLPGNQAGVYRPYQNIIAIDPTHRYAGQPSTGVGTPAHEGLHAYTAQLIRDLNAGRISITDPRYPLLQMLRLNDRFYSSPDDNELRYKRQPLEAYANTVISPLADLVEAIKARQRPPNYQR